jgi:hypothetical protein
MQTKIKNVIKFNYSKTQNIISQWWIKWIQPFMQESYENMICEFENNLIVCFCYLFLSCVPSDVFLVNEENLKILNFEKILLESGCGPDLFPQNPSHFYFVARQSKSRRLFLFDAAKLAKSNANLVSSIFLFEICPIDYRHRISTWKWLY